jgi:hypothetical protein
MWTSHYRIAYFDGDFISALSYYLSKREENLWFAKGCNWKHYNIHVRHNILWKFHTSDFTVFTSGQQLSEFLWLFMCLDWCWGCYPGIGPTCIPQSLNQGCTPLHLICGVFHKVRSRGGDFWTHSPMLYVVAKWQKFLRPHRCVRNWIKSRG